MYWIGLASRYVMPHGRLDWARDAATSVHRCGCTGFAHIGCTVVLHRPPRCVMHMADLDWARDAAHCIAAPQDVARDACHMADWIGRGMQPHVGALLYCSPTSRYVMHMADWIGRGMQPHGRLDWARVHTVVLHRPPQDASCTWPIGLGEGCSHIGALLYCIAHLKIVMPWPIGLGEGCVMHMADWIGRGMQPHRCTVVLHRPPHASMHIGRLDWARDATHRPPQDTSHHWIGRGMQPHGRLVHRCVLHRPHRRLGDAMPHGRLDWARDAATSVPIGCIEGCPPVQDAHLKIVMHGHGEGCMTIGLGEGCSHIGALLWLHRPPQDASCTWPTGLGEGCSHIGPVVLHRPPQDVSLHMADWIGRGMQPHRCTVVAASPTSRCVMHMADWIGRGMHDASGLGEGCSHIGALLYCIAHLKMRHAHGRLDWARDAATWPTGLGEGCSHIGALLYCIAHLKIRHAHGRLDWARYSHIGAVLHRPPQDADGRLDWARDAATWPIGLGEGCSHIGALLYCIAHLKIRYAHGRLDWARDAATSVHCCTASPTSRYVMHMADWIGRGMQPHRCTVVLHRPPQDASCAWPIGLGEGCMADWIGRGISHIGALLYCIAHLKMRHAHGRLDWARDAATSVHCCTDRPPQDASCTWPTGLGEGCSHIGALLYCIAHLKIRHAHGRLDWARDAATCA